MELENTKQEIVQDFNVSDEDLQNVVENQFFRIMKLIFNEEGTFYLTQKCDGNVCMTEYTNLLNVPAESLKMLAVCEYRRRSASQYRDSKDGKISTSLYTNAQKETQQFDGRELAEKKKRISVNSLSEKMKVLFFARRSGEITEEQFQNGIDLLEFEYTQS